MALHGSIEDFSVSGIIRLIASHEKSGVLTIERDSDRLLIGFHDGFIHGAASENHSERFDLLSYFIREGILQRDVALGLRDEAAQNGGVLSLDLLGAHGISDDEIRSFVEYKVGEVLLLLQFWRSGHYSFETADDMYPRGVSVLLPAVEMLHNASERYDRLLPIFADLPTDNTPLELATGLENLNTEQAQLVEVCGIPAPVTELLAASPYQLEVTLQLIAEMNRDGLLRPVVATKVAGTAPAASASRLDLVRQSEELVRLIARGTASRALYPPKHPMMMTVAGTLQAFVEEQLLRGSESFRLKHSEDRLYVQDVMLPYPHDQFRSFIELLKTNGVRKIVFLPGLSKEETDAFLGLLGSRTEHASSRGNLKSALSQAKLSRIKIVPMRAGVSRREHYDQRQQDTIDSWDTFLGGTSSPDAMFEIVRRNPEQAARRLLDVTGFSPAVDTADGAVQVDITRNTLSRLIETVQRSQLTTVNERKRAVQGLFANLPVDLQRRLLLDRPSVDQPFAKQIDDFLAAMDVQRQADLFAVEVQERLSVLVSSPPADHQRVMGNLREMLHRLLDRTETGSELSSRMQLLGHVRTRLTNLGISARTIAVLTEDGATSDPRIADVLAQADGQQVAGTFPGTELVEETRELVRQLSVNQDDHNLNLILAPFTKSLNSESWETRQQTANALYMLGDAISDGKSLAALDEVLTAFFNRINIEQVHLVYATLTSCLEKIAVKLRTNRLDTPAQRITSLLADHLSELSDRSKEDRVLIAYCLGRIGDNHAISTLLNLLDDQDIQADVSSALMQNGIRIAEPLLELLRHAEKHAVRWRACHMLHQLGEEVVPLLQRELQSPIWFMRRNVVMVLGRILPPSLPQDLESLLNDTSVQVRREVAIALGLHRSQDAEELLIRMLNDRNSMIRRVVASHLARIGSPSAVPPLAALLHRRRWFRNEDAEVRREACNALGRIGSTLAVEPLVDVLREMTVWRWRQHREVFLAAIQALGRIGGGDAKRVLMQLGRVRSAEMRQAALDALQSIHIVESPS